MLATQRELAAVHHQRGDAAAARQVLETAYQAGRFSLGDDDPLMLQISYDLGVVAEELGRRDEAREAFGRVADHGPMMLGVGHWAVTRAQAYLGQDPTTPFRVEPAHRMPQGGLSIPTVPAQQPLVTPPDAQPTVTWPAPPAPGHPWSSPQPVTDQPPTPAPAHPQQIPAQPTPAQPIPSQPIPERPQSVPGQPRQETAWEQQPSHADQHPRTLPAPAELPAWLQKPEQPHTVTRSPADTQPPAAPQPHQAIPAQRQPEADLRKPPTQPSDSVLPPPPATLFPPANAKPEHPDTTAPNQPEEQSQTGPNRPEPSVTPAQPVHDAHITPSQSEAAQKPETASTDRETFRPESPWGPAPRVGKEPTETPFQQVKPGVFGMPQGAEAEAPPALYHRGSNDAVVVQRPDPVIMPLRPEPGPQARPDAVTGGDPVSGQSIFPVRPEHPPVARPESVTPGVSAPSHPVAPVTPEPISPTVPDRVMEPAPTDSTAVRPAHPDPTDAEPVHPEPVEPLHPEPAPGPWSGEPHTRHPQPPLDAPTAKQHIIEQPPAEEEPAADRPVAAQQPGVYGTGGGSDRPVSGTNGDAQHPISGVPGVYQGGDVQHPISGVPGVYQTDAPQPPISSPPGVYRTGDIPHQTSAPTHPAPYQPTQPGVYQQDPSPAPQYGPAATHPAHGGYQQTDSPGIYQQQPQQGAHQPGVYHQSYGGAWQHGPAASHTPAVPTAYEKSEEPAATRKRGMALFAVIAATIAAVVAVVAMVYTLAQNTRTGEEGDTGGGAPTLAGDPPTAVKLADNGTTIDVSWHDPANATASFMVTMAHPGEQLKPVSTVGPGQTSRRIEGLSPKLEYCFAVVAVYATDKFATSPQVCTDRGKK